MSKDYTQFDWASDRLSRANWDEDEFLGTIDKRVRRTRRITGTMRKMIRRVIAALAWGVIAERRQSELNEEHMRTRGYYVNSKHEIITI